MMDHGFGEGARMQILSIEKEEEEIQGTHWILTYSSTAGRTWATEALR